MVLRAAAPAPEEKTNLYGLDRGALTAFLEALDAPAFHAGQIYRWLYARHALDPRDWTDLPLDLRRRIARIARVDPGTLERSVQAADGTIKYRVLAGDAVECVAMRQAGRMTLCLSSQVGCALGCDFCLTGKMGLKRHLGAGEIVAQVALMRRDCEIRDAFNLVFMGMGEPLHNYAAVVAALGMLCDAEGFGLSRRRITVSTAGLAPAIERLAAEPVRPRLAVSLNAATDTLRDRLMPINRRYPLARLREACRAFAAATGERVTFEYVLLAGVNDGDEDIRRLAALAGAERAKINLIPFNAVPGRLAYEAPPRERVLRIRDRLLGEGVAASVRWSRGAAARAACGQLAFLDRETG